MTPPPPTRFRHAARGSAIVIVIWAVAIAAVIVAGAQMLAFRQATLGREALAKVEARWAARAGLEETIAVLEYHTEKPEADDARQIFRDLESVADGSLASGEWSIRHSEDGFEKKGPQDESAKINLNTISKTQLQQLSGMSLDVSDAIVDFRDTDNSPGMMGAENEFYKNRGLTYGPRNADFRSVAELELVLGAFPQNVRGEDANLNGRLDPNENDRGESEPADDGDGLLDAGWSGYVTARSHSLQMGASGEPKLYLKDAAVEDMTERLTISAEQAALIKTWATTSSARMEQLLSGDVGNLSSQSQPQNQRGRDATGGGGAGRSGRSSQGATGGNQRASNVPKLDQNQLRRVFQEATLDDPTKPAPGRVNVNTALPSVLRILFVDDPISADAIMTLRNSKPGGVLALSDLLQSSRVSPDTLARLGGVLDTQSAVFTITSRGRSASTGLEVEITAVVDRSTLPARILEYREQ
ncbi:MAG: hypothetical protein EXS10_00225 [Phycisphaerales bacterium]|nr:hypothetical protein [Phycisphaerales bacterium]